MHPAKHLLSLAIWTILATQVGLAGQLPINNPSFEDPAQGPGGYTINDVSNWDPSGNTGVWRPGATMGPLPDGLQVGYVNRGSLSQTLSSVLQPGTTYTLSIDVGGRVDGYLPNTDYSVSLLAGGNTLASVTPEAITAGGWTTLTATYVSGSSVSADALEILISYTGSGGGQFDFDKVSLDAVGPTASVPEAGNVVWIGALALLALSRYAPART